MLARLLHLAVGLLAYLLSVGSMAYFAGFLAGLLVPKGIDTGAVGPPAVAFAVDLALLLSFAVVHSLLARDGAKAWMVRWVPAPLERSAYSALAGLQMVALCALWRPLPEPVWQVAAPAAQVALLALAGCGWLIVLAALWIVGDVHLFGLAQAWAAARGRPYQPRPLEARGIYRVIRHPLYSGTLLALWAAPTMSRGHLLLAAIFTLYLAIGYRFEERDLARHHGAPYLAYRNEVPAFFPRLGRPRRLR
jgi:protein-S-isoprenylcysteine O-methyltransferase Ste14